MLHCRSMPNRPRYPDTPVKSANGRLVTSRLRPSATALMMSSTKYVYRANPSSFMVNTLWTLYFVNKIRGVNVLVLLHRLTHVLMIHSHTSTCTYDPQMREMASSMRRDSSASCDGIGGDGGGRRSSVGSDGSESSALTSFAIDQVCLQLYSPTARLQLSPKSLLMILCVVCCSTRCMCRTIFSLSYHTRN